jgi:hypothetical protein
LNKIYVEIYQERKRMRRGECCQNTTRLILFTVIKVFVERRPKQGGKTGKVKNRYRGFE